MDTHRSTVRDRDGVVALISGEIVDPKRVLIELQNGRKLLVPRSAFQWNGDTGYSVPFTFDGLEEFSGDDQGIVVPVFREEAVVDQVTRDTGVVRIEKRVEEREEVVNGTATINEVDIERVLINEFVDEAPGIRYEGDTMIMPLMEEVLVVEKRLLLREELRITKTSREEPRHEKVVLRSEYAEAKRESRSDADPGTWPLSAEDFVAFRHGSVAMRETAEEPLVSKEARSVDEVVVTKASVM